MHPQSIFLATIRKNKNKSFVKIIIIYSLKDRCILHRHVYVMQIESNKIGLVVKKPVFGVSDQV